MLGGIFVALKVLGRVQQLNGHLLDLNEIKDTPVPKLLAFLRNIEEEIKSKRRECVFLSVDIVGSREMKIGERDLAIIVTSDSYHEMVKRSLAENRVWKSSWTPDGLMAVFFQADEALLAAKTILTRLDRFNENDNRLRSPISVRCGIAWGNVAISEEMELEHVSDQAIDYAGHLQKQSPANSILIAPIAYRKVNQKHGIDLWPEKVDDRDAYLYSKALTEDEANG